MIDEKPILAVPLGDAAGIRPEIIQKRTSGFLESYPNPIIVGDRSVLELGKKIAG